ncbi:iron-containing alcohol dehydrogenase [uncultured Bacteroides sp.]|uniref:iron-containing alcohol dehydrogenase n=1 Tax=uncultured Bacteroides sp. TaxID=162156 RepID=UPI002610CB39|nr:iron-containing alcohol dehydrogenase [uncultured Bacteroides sp.]
MNNFTFYSPTEFVFGKDTELQTGELVRKYNGHKALIVYGGGSVVRSGLLDRVKTSLKNAGVEFVELGGVQPNPTDPKVYEGIDLGRSEKVDFLLPVGGGSVIDTAKAIAAGILYDGDFWDFYVGKVVIKKALRLGVVLTIPAAGSEGSGNSVITKVDGLKKLSVRTPEALRPAFAVMNPELTYTLPAWQTASGVTDMMAHIMERYFSNTQGVEIADRMCEGVLKSIITEAPKVIADPKDYNARANIMWAGTVAHNGTCGVGCVEDWASHFMEHEVSAVYDVTHGAGLAVIFPAWLTYMADHNVHKVAQFAERVWDVPASDDKKAVALEGIARFKKFLKAIGMPVTFKELGIENPDIDLLVKKLHENKGELVGNYVQLDKKATREIYELANR